MTDKMTESFKMCNIWKDELIVKRNRVVEGIVSNKLHVFEVYDFISFDISMHP